VFTFYPHTFWPVLFFVFLFFPIVVGSVDAVSFCVVRFSLALVLAGYCNVLDGGKITLSFPRRRGRWPVDLVSRIVSSSRFMSFLSALGSRYRFVHSICFREPHLTRPLLASSPAVFAAGRRAVMFPFSLLLRPEQKSHFPFCLPPRHSCTSVQLLPELRSRFFPPLTLHFRVFNCSLSYRCGLILSVLIEECHLGVCSPFSLYFRSQAGVS